MLTLLFNQPSGGPAPPTPPPGPPGGFVELAAIYVPGGQRGFQHCPGAAVVITYVPSQQFIEVKD